MNWLMNALSYQKNRLDAINKSGQMLCLHQISVCVRSYYLLSIVYVHVKHRGIARVAVLCYHAKICLLKFRNFCQNFAEFSPNLTKFFRDFSKMQHFSEITNYPALIPPPYPEPPQFRQILEPVSVLFFS